MRFSFLSLLALATPFFPQPFAFDTITQPLEDATFAVGSPLDIVWEAGSVTGTITINLLQGATNTTLSLGQVVAASIENSLGTYTWTVPADVAGYATYGFMITLDANTTEFQYSFPFHITASTSTGASATGGATTTVKVSLASTYTAAATSTSTANVTSSYSYSNATSNATLSSTLAVKTTTSSATKTSSVAGTSTSSGAAAATSKSAAVAKVANGGLAIVGGLLMAFAL